ncbi:MAG: hypothetical protein RBG13Loki_1346 [Promethearchaeota archaeon CR_4]|nr:MAG: hypothetical protein RBG13Loki_1346 [Candidatus Lokiarchaeota archaeon CR_4]
MEFSRLNVINKLFQKNSALLIRIVFVTRIIISHMSEVPPDSYNPEAMATQQQYSPVSQQVQSEIDKWVTTANLNIHIVKCLISPNKDSILGILENEKADRSYLSLALLNWNANIWKGTYTRLHPNKLPFPVHGFYTPSTPFKSYLTTQELPPLFIQLYDYTTRKYLEPRKNRFALRKNVVRVNPVSAAWVPGMDDISTFLRSELTKTYPKVPPASILGRRIQKKIGRKRFVLNLVDTLQLRPSGNGTIIGQDFILEFDLGRVSIPLARNTTFNIVAFIVDETWRILTDLAGQEISPHIDNYLAQDRFKCQWCNYGAASITKLDTDFKFPYPSPVFEALITCPKCHEKSRAVFSGQESGIQKDARHRLLICEKCGKDGLQIIGRKAGLGRGSQVKVYCTSCGNTTLRQFLRSFTL